MLWSTGLGAARPAPRRGPCRTAHHSEDLPGQRRRPPADDLPIRSSEDPGSAAPGPRSGQPRRRRQIARGLGPVGTLRRSSLSEPADGAARRVAATARPTQTLASRPTWRVTARPARRVTALPTRRVTTRRVTSLPKTARAARTIAVEAVGHPDSLNVQLLEDRGAGPPAPGTRAPRGSDPAYQADPRGPAPWLPVRPDPPGRVELRSNAPDDLADRDARDARDAGAARNAPNAPNARDARDGRDAGAARNARDARGARADGDSQDGGRARETSTAQEPSDALDHVPHSAAPAAPAALVQHHRRRLLPYRAWATSRWAASGGSLRRPCQHLRDAETDYCPASASRHWP